MELSIYDKKIIKFLHVNSRAPISFISKKTKINREVVSYNMKKLYAKGIIRNYFTRINIGQLVQGTQNILIRVNRNNLKRYEEILEFLINFHSINWVAEFVGDYDISFTLLYSGFNDLKEIVAEIHDFIGDDLLEQRTLNHITELKFDRTNIVKTNIEENSNIDKKIEFNSESNKSNLSFNEDDIIILKELSNNSRIKLTQIAKKTKIGEDMIRLRIKEFERKKLIIDYSISFNVDKLNYETYALYLNLRNLSNLNLNKLENYCNSNKNIVFSALVSGEFNVSITISVPNRSKFNDIFVDLRNLFGNDLLNYEFQINLNIHKESMIPKAYLEKHKLLLINK